MRIVAVAGRQYSGKSSVGHILESNGMVRIEAEDLIKARTGSAGVPITIARLLRKEGPGIIGLLAAAEIDRSDGKEFALIGPRSMQDIEHLRGRFGEVKVLALNVPMLERLGRMRSAMRDRPEGRGALAEFMRREMRESLPSMRSANARHGLTRLLRGADITINNYAGKAKLRAVVNYVHKVELVGVDHRRA